MDKTEEYISDEGNYSSISSTSGLSGYEDELTVTEFKTLHHSTDTEKQRFLFDAKQNKVQDEVVAHDDVHVNKSQLERHANFELLLKRNIFLEDELYKSKVHVETIRRNSKLGHANAILTENGEKENRILSETNQDLHKQTDKLKHHLYISQEEYKCVKQKLNELEIRQQCKESSIIQLKKKITEQQQDIQKLLQRNLKSNSEITEYQNELTTTKKCVDWYKTQWHNNQIDKNAMLKEILDLKTSVTNKNDEIGRLNLVLNELKVQQRKECETLQHKLREETHKSPILQDNSIKLIKTEPNTYYINEIESLSKEIDSVKDTLSKQSDLLEIIVKEKSEILQKNTVLQTQVNEHELQLQMHEHYKQEAQQMITDYEYSIKEKDQRLLYLKSELNKLRIALDSSSKEKQSIQESVNVVQSGFQKFLTMHEELKEELKDKNKLVYTLEKELQAGFMNQNWNKCAIEEHKAKEASYLKRMKVLTQDIAGLNQSSAVHVDENGKLILELKEIKKMYKDLLLAYDALAKENKNVTRNMEECARDFESANNKITFYKKSLEELNVHENGQKHYVDVLNTLCHKLGIAVNLEINLEEVVHKIELFINSQSIANCNCKELSKQLENRCVGMAKKSATDEELIARLRSDVQNLRDVLKVKELALHDKQERYEMYYRTLLKKVKEQLSEKRNISNANIQLKAQQHDAFENINTLTLQLNQYELDLDTVNVQLTKNNEHIKSLKQTIKSLESNIVSYNVLESKYDELVSCHSKCSSDCVETHQLQEKLDFYINEIKNANCTINGQITLIEKLQHEKSNAVKLISTVENDNLQLKQHVHNLVKEKSFLQRLIIDLRAALNASTCRTKFNRNITEYESLPIDFDRFSSPAPLDETEITLLIEKTKNRKPFVDLQQSITDLKLEMSKMQNHLLTNMN